MSKLSGDEHGCTDWLPSEVLGRGKVAPDLVDRSKRGMPVGKTFVTRMGASQGRVEQERCEISAGSGEA